MNDTPRPDTVVLVHGLWMTPRSWEHWVEHYQAKGFTVLTPGYPGFDIEVEALRENPDDHRQPDRARDRRPPRARDRAAGDTRRSSWATPSAAPSPSCCWPAASARPASSIDSAPTEGVRVNPLSQARSLFPALKNPANRHRAVGFTPEEFHYAFTNTLSEEDSRAVWERYAIPAPGNWVWEFGLFANFKPGHQDTWVDYSADRAPLLFIAGGKDHIMPPSVNKSNAKHYKKSPALTEYHEFEGRDHWTCAAPGWEAVADYALDWAMEHANTEPRVSADG